MLIDVLNVNADVLTHYWGKYAKYLLQFAANTTH